MKKFLSIIGNYLKKMKLLKIETTKGTLALDGERRLEFSFKNKANIKINYKGPECLKLEEILSN